MSAWLAARGTPSRFPRGVQLLWRAVAVAAVLVALVWLFSQDLSLDAEAIRLWLVALGPIGPAAYILLYAAQVVCAPLPGLPIGAAAGFAFGLLPALAYGTVGLTIGVVVAMVCGRVWGLRLLARVAGPSAIARWERMRLVNSPLTWLVVFLGPSPDLILFVAGMTRVPLRWLIPIGIVGRAPAMAAATLIGAGILDMGPWLLIGASGVGLLFGAGGLLLQRFAPAPQAGSGDAA